MIFNLKLGLQFSDGKERIVFGKDGKMTRSYTQTHTGLFVRLSQVLQHKTVSSLTTYVNFNI